MDSLPTREQLRTLLHAEYNRTFTGWDFSRPCRSSGADLSTTSC